MTLILELISFVLLIFAIYKGTPALFKYLALRALATGKNDKAISRYKVASTIFGGNKQYKIEHALVLMRLGEYQNAETILTALILDRSLPQKNKISAKTYRAMAYLKQGRKEEALEDMEELFETAKTTITYGMMGYLKQLDGGAELDLCKEAYEYNSDDRDICDNLLVAYIRTGDYENADEIASALREKFPYFLEGFYHSAMLELKKGNKKAASEYLEKTADCKRSSLTTISAEDIENLRKEIKNA